MPSSKVKKTLNTNKNSQEQGLVRIIGGQMRGRKLKFSLVEGLRPSLDRIRETLFNWLAVDIQQAICLDLFAGSGAIGFEAVSRGAAQVTLVELSPKVARDLQNNAQLIKADNINIVLSDAKSFLQKNQQKFDLVFLDPPFGQGLLSEVLLLLPPFLNPNALVYIEQENAETAYTPDENWIEVKFNKTSRFSYALYQLK